MVPDWSRGALIVALFLANIPANQTGGAMTADRIKTDLGSSKAQPGSASPNRPPAPDNADGRDDEVSNPSMAELSRRLAERAARQRAVDPGAAKAAHRAALQSGLAKHVVLKYTPHLVFHLDDSIERGTRVIKIMQEIESTRETKA